MLQRSFKTKDQAVTRSTSFVTVNIETIQIDPQLLFQRLIAAGTRNDQLEEIFQFELCSYPPAIFEASYVMRPANKSALADAIWALMPNMLLDQLDKASMYWMAGPWCTEYRGSGVQPTITYNYVDCSQMTSQEDMDMPLLCSSGTRKNHPRKMVLVNAAQVEEHQYQWISHRIWS